MPGHNEFSMALAAENANDTITKIFQAIYDSDKYKDITFIVAGKEVFANELVVKMRSSVLKARIEDPTRIPKGRILLDDQNLEDFNEFLKFLHVNDCEVTVENCIELYFLGKKYNVPSLCTKTMETFEANLNKYNAQFIFFKAVNDIVYAEFLQKIFAAVPSVLEHICFYTINFGTTKILPIGLMEYLLKLERPIEVEVVLFRMVLDWAKIHCRVRGIPEDPPHLKNAMSTLLPLIRFKKFKKTDLASVVRSSGIFTTQELLQLFIDVTLNQCNNNDEEEENVVAAADV